MRGTRTNKRGSGAGDQHAKAQSQLTKQATNFDEMSKKPGGIALVLADGTDITPLIDPASAATGTAATRGPAGKGFDKSIGLTAADLDRATKSIMKSRGTK